MSIRIFALIIACVASACQAAEPSGPQQGEVLVELAQHHFGIRDAVRSTAKAAGSTNHDDEEVRYDRPTGERFATYYIGVNGELREFIVNQPDSQQYLPIKGRQAFIERMMEVVTPVRSEVERAWAAKQLDSVWTRRVRPLPVQVDQHVFRGMTVSGAHGTHDAIWIVAASTGATGLRYKPHP